MRRVLLCLGLIAVWFVACNGQPPPTTPSIIITNTATNTNGGSSGGTTDASCDPVVRVDINAPTSMLTGETERLDATPKSASGQRSDSCNLVAGISWAATPTGVCSLNGATTSFTPNLHADAHGTCTVTAVVSGVGGIAVVSVQ